MPLPRGGNRGEVLLHTRVFGGGGVVSVDPVTELPILALSLGDRSRDVGAMTMPKAL